MKYVSVPSELSSLEVRNDAYCLSPGRYIRFIPPKVKANSSYVTLDKLVVLRNKRIKIKKGDWYRYAEIGDIDVTTGGITFRVLRGYELPNSQPSIATYGDILVSTVRTYRKGIGYVAEAAENLVTTNALMNICGLTDYIPKLTLLYIYSFLRTDFFTEQVWSMLNRGVYPRMDKGALDKIIIPVSSDEMGIRYISALMQAIIDKERMIRERAETINQIIQSELETGQSTRRFTFEYPTLNEIRQLKRLDAAIYDREYKSKIWLIQNYARGSATPEEEGFEITPGPSLEIKIIRTRIDSEIYKPGFYALILPKNISVYGTMNVIQYIGTAKKLPLLREGDIIFGEAGFQKGRSIVLLDGIEKCTTNAHGLYARRKDGNIHKSIFFRCIFNWYRSMRLIDLMAVGGSGGHFSPEYFNYLRIPKFPECKQATITRLYHNPSPPPSDNLTLDNFVDWHRRWNDDLGIWELDREMKELQNTLANLQDKIIEGKNIQIPF